MATLSTSLGHPVRTPGDHESVERQEVSAKRWLYRDNIYSLQLHTYVHKGFTLSLTLAQKLSLCLNPQSGFKYILMPSKKRGEMENRITHKIGEKAPSDIKLSHSNKGKEQD